MKIRKLLFREAANLICWFRILASVALALASRHVWGWAALYSLAFLSDVWDGWCHRRVPEAERPKHWFNCLPITMDPLADFVFVCGGIIHVAESKWLGVVVCLILTVVQIMWMAVAARACDEVFMVMMTVMTYAWFALMVLMMIMVWCYSAPTVICIGGVMVTLVTFYVSFFKNRDKSRTIRKRG